MDYLLILYSHSLGHLLMESLLADVAIKVP